MNPRDLLVSVPQALGLKMCRTMAAANLNSGPHACVTGLRDWAISPAPTMCKHGKWSVISGLDRSRHQKLGANQIKVALNLTVDKWSTFSQLIFFFFFYEAIITLEPKTLRRKFGRLVNTRCES